MIAKLKKYKLFLPCGFISLCVLPILLLLRIELTKKVNIELNVVQNNYLFTTLIPGRSEIQINENKTLKEILGLSAKIGRESDTLNYYRVSLRRVESYNDLIMILDSFIENGLLYCLADNSLIVWYLKPDGDYHPLSQYLPSESKIVFGCGMGHMGLIYLNTENSFLENFLIQYGPEDKKEEFVQMLMIISFYWLFMCIVNVYSSIRFTNGRRLTSRSS